MTEIMGAVSATVWKWSLFPRHWPTGPSQPKFWLVALGVGLTAPRPRVWPDTARSWEE